MRLFAISFLLGILIPQQFSKLPLIPWESGLILCLVALALLGKFRYVSGLILGFLYAVWLGTYLLEKQLTPTLEGKDLILRGIISSIPYQRENGWKFRFHVDEIVTAEGIQAPSFEGTLRLNWHHTGVSLQADEKWQLTVRLKRRSGFFNPGGFDYEKWLFQERIIATGYVRKSAQNKRLQGASPFSVNSLRETILHTINRRIEDPGQAAIVGALAVAERSAISRQQWEIFRNTGTNHLVAISGLHIGMVAGFGFLPVLLLWWLFPRLYLLAPVRLAGGVLGAVFAAGYALLAGFTLPTQRALIMVLVVMFGLVLRRQYAPSSVMATALLAVLIYDPLAVLSQGFWLSFVAVGLILYVISRRLRRSRFDIISVQLALSVGMLPLTLAFFGTGSLSSPLANLLAIPWVSFVVVPLTLVGVLLLPFEALSTVVLQLAGLAAGLMGSVLETMSSPQFLLQSSAIPDHLLILVFAGFLVLLLPYRFPGRWLGLILILPLFTYEPRRLEQGAFDYHLLDVGQGLSSVIQTRNHVMIYDAGPRFNDSFDTGELVLAPFLRSLNVDQVNMLMISHEDLDHRGGARFILQTLDVDQIVSSDTRLFASARLCQQGMQWRWDEVHFEILSPPDKSFQSDNDRSCVLRISNGHHSLLLTGDIEKEAERYLLRHADKIRADVMLAPHHGSKTSSLRAFIKAVDPDLALVAAGYRNRFRFPHSSIVSRYERLDTPLLSTASEGAISLKFVNNSQHPGIQTYRGTHGRYWNRPARKSLRD